MGDGSPSLASAVMTQVMIHKIEGILPKANLGCY